MAHIAYVPPLEASCLCRLIGPGLGSLVATIIKAESKQLTLVFVEVIFTVNEERSQFPSATHNPFKYTWFY